MHYKVNPYFFLTFGGELLTLSPPPKGSRVKDTASPFDIHAVLRVSWGLRSDKFASL